MVVVKIVTALVIVLLLFKVAIYNNGKDKKKIHAVFYPNLTVFYLCMLAELSKMDNLVLI